MLFENIVEGDAEGNSLSSTIKSAHPERVSDVNVVNISYLNRDIEHDSDLEREHEE